MKIIQEITQHLNSWPKDSQISDMYLKKACKEIKKLQEWIRQEGERNNTCTRGILSEVCKDCKCGKSQINLKGN